jgi:polyhydroxyalkanoate synthesis regulator phasin
MIFETIRNALLAGLGAQAAVKEFVEELIKKGEVSESQGANLVKDWMDKARKGTIDMQPDIPGFMTMAMDKMNLATKDDIDRVNTKIHDLSERLKHVEKAPTADSE